MKHIVFSILLLSTFIVYGQETLRLKPGPSDMKDARISIGGGDPYTQDKNYGDFQNIVVRVWTFNGNPAYYRALMEFDLSELKPTDSIIYAGLSLFFDPGSPLGSTHEPHSGYNQTVLQHIITPWEENKVTWNTQPSVTTYHQTFIRGNRSHNESFINMDITSLIQDQVSLPDRYQGFQLKLIDERPYQRLLFASSDHWNPELHPELIVTFYRDVTSNNDLDENDLVIYANPVGSVLKLKNVQDQGGFEIFDPMGRLVEKGSYSNSSLDVQALPPGCYILNVKNESGHSRFKKFIKS